MRILAISGSLRAVSSNTTLLRVAAAVAPAGVEVALYDGLARLPHFNPDLDRVLDDPNLPQSVQELRSQIGAADGVLISSPEYAHGVPGSLKNALDWLVGGSEMPGKPVALINASPHAVHAQDSLAETLRTMSVELVAGSPFAVKLGATRLDETGVSADPDATSAILGALLALGRAVQARRGWSWDPRQS